ncbi:suppressor of cytokine signaling 6 isoform X2 [Sitophilus oryzae]|uniref:Suppressor of cytokine signaling 6 isoform X2 n=1 Tax=Sitophilus oryzae TaxID=7048 RepID=A0A6J2XHC4_SITOR|nr:suppressor of cytokine signaling 6 isoform X2 [Sitophilus oryzae]
MDQQNSSNRTKSWLCHLRYMKMFKSSGNSDSDASQIRSSPSDFQIEQPIQRSVTTNSLDDTRSAQMRRHDSNFRRSLRKWHTRMKNCFSKNTKQAPASDIRHQKSEQIQGQVTRTETCTNIRNNSYTLSRCVWYWGPASKTQVEAKLDGAPDGSFLVRDSASDRHIFTISFRSVGQTLHARIDYTWTGYKLFDHEGYSLVVELIEKAMEKSREGVFCYTLSQGEQPNFPVRLLKPISRFEKVRSLQSLSRFVIRQHVMWNNIENLCLPLTLISYLKEEDYFC